MTARLFAISLLAWLLSGCTQPAVERGPVTGAPATPPAVPRSVELRFTGGMDLTLREIGKGDNEGKPLCLGGISGDPTGVSYLFPLLINYDRVTVSFVVHRTATTGAFALGDYPDASTDAPAAINVVLFRIGPGEGFAIWNSGSGTLVIDAGGRSGSVTATLPFVGWRKLPQQASSPAPTGSLGPLQLTGTWVCPVGS